MMIFGAAALSGAGGCATFMSGGGEQMVRVNSSPSGAAVKIDGRDFGVTPTMAKLTRKDSHIVRLELAGYQPRETQLEKSLNPWVFGNILLGGVIGVVVDVVTGGINELKPDEVDLTFGPKPGSTPGNTPLGLNVRLQANQGGQ
jgi:hypothetical protein